MTRSARPDRHAATRASDPRDREGRRSRRATATRAALVAILAVGLGACSAHRPVPASDAQLAAGLVGVWCNSTDGGRTCWAFDEFDATGRFEACGRHDDEPFGFLGRGPYIVSGQRMCYVVDQATANFWLGVGGRYCTDILAIGSERHRYRDIDTGQEFELIRIPGSRKACPDTR